MMKMNLSIKWDVSSVLCTLILIFRKKLGGLILRKCRCKKQQTWKPGLSKHPRWVRLRVKSKMMASLWATSSNSKGMKSSGILGCLTLNPLLWGHDLTKTNDSDNKSLFSLDGKRATSDFQWVLNRFNSNMARCTNTLSSNLSSNRMTLTLLNVRQTKENQCSLFPLKFLDN